MPGIGARTESYRDRRHAGRVLAGKVTERNLADPVVLGLARGGVPVAAEVARALAAPLRVTVARKIGAPGQPELALGAVTAHGPATYDERLLRTFHLEQAELAQDRERERAEARSREERFGQGAPPRLTSRDVVLVDDGLATGAPARAALRMIRESDPRSILLAVPVAVLSVLAIAFLPNVPLNRMTTRERAHALEADLATVSVDTGVVPAAPRAGGRTAE